MQAQAARAPMAVMAAHAQAGRYRCIGAVTVGEAVGAAMAVMAVAFAARDT